MKISIQSLLVGLLFTTGAYAQSGAAAPGAAQTPAPTRGYAEIVAQSAFGNVTSQSFGGEIGVTVLPRVQVFVEAGLIRDAAPASLGAKAETIAAGIARAAGSADFHVRQPIGFGLAGVKYLVPVTAAKVEPYVLAGGGFGRVKRDVTFTTPSGDLSQFVALGGDLTGTETSGMLSAGGGVGLIFWPRVMIDLQYRFGRVFSSGDAINTSRAGAGIGVRF